MRLVDRSLTLSRRGLLKGGMATGAAYAALSGTRLVLGKGGAWAMELKSLSTEQGAALMHLARDLFPHDQLIDAFYAQAIAPLDDEAAKDPATKTLLEAGLADLDARTMKDGGKPFAETIDEAKRVAAITAIEGSPFFAKVYGAAQGGIYANPDVWPKFGFEGPSSPKGGYLHRGFNDLDWL
jgi:hypothetical protein